MTPANVKRVKELAKHFHTLAVENPRAEAAMWAMLKAIGIIQSIASDLHFRPEANNETQG